MLGWGGGDDRGKGKEERMRRMDRETETQTVQVSGGRWGGWGDRSTGLTRPRYPGNSTGELCCCSRLHGDRSMCAVCV